MTASLTLADEAQAGEDLMDAIYDFLGRFIAYPSEAAHVAHVLWIQHTHLMDS